MPVWNSLLANLATVALFVLSWNQAQGRLDGCSRFVRTAVFAAVMGGGAVISMTLAVRLQPGVIFDLRASLIAVAGFLGGPAAGLIAAAIAAAYRAWIGGQGMMPGVIGIAAAAGVGMLGHMSMRGRCAKLGHVLGLAAAVATVTTLSFWMLPAAIRSVALSDFGAATCLLNSAATAVAALAILHMQELARERELLRAALAQAPDFQFVKNRRGEFVAVNRRVADHNGFRRPADMRGRTDFEITTPGRARKLHDEEQAVMRTGEPLLDKEERLSTVNGGAAWFSTSKSPLRDGDGDVIGLAGVTRDVTRQKQAEAALVLNQHLVMDAMSEVADGVALFDAQGCLVYHNGQFPNRLAVAPGAALHGLHAVELFRAAQMPLGTPPGGAEAWAQKAADAVIAGGAMEVQFADLRWLSLRARRAREGGATVVVSDVTRQREAGRMLDTFMGGLRALNRIAPVQVEPARRALGRDIEAALAQAAALRNALAA